MNGHTINYEHLAKEALRSVVKTVLQSVLTDGLPGDHHFYISFHTTAPGVKISSRISAQYPKEMTIVLQHQFWDLKVEEEHFEVRLSFSNIPELLIVPYSAIKVFFDPSVPYGLQFDHSSRPEAVEDKSGFLEDSWQIPLENGDQDIDEITNISSHDNKEKASTNSNPSPDLISDGIPTPEAKEIKDNEKSITGSKEEEAELKSLEDDEQPDDENEGAEIVSLDAFRKKNN